MELTVAKVPKKPPSDIITTHQRTTTAVQMSPILEKKSPCLPMATLRRQAWRSLEKPAHPTPGKKIFMEFSWKTIWSKSFPIDCSIRKLFRKNDVLGFVNRTVPNVCVYTIILPSLLISDVLLLPLLSLPLPHFTPLFPFPHLSLFLLFSSDPHLVQFSFICSQTYKNMPDTY